MIRSYFQMLIDEGKTTAAGTIADPEETARETRQGQGKMKQFASWFTHGIPGGAALRKSIYECKTGPAILDAVDHFFESRLDAQISESDLIEHEAFEPELVVES
jgi:tRNA-dihydrouridine synthase